MSKKYKKKHKKDEVDDNDLKKITKKELLHRAKKFSDQYCVGEDKNFTLKDKPTSYFGDEDEMDLEYPKVSPEKIAELNEVKKALLEEND